MSRPTDSRSAARQRELIEIAERYRDALEQIVEADDEKRAAAASGQHTNIRRWIPTEEAIDAARELLRRGDA